MPRAVRLVRTDKNQKCFWVQLTETSTETWRGVPEGTGPPAALTTDTQLLPLRHRALPRWRHWLCPNRASPLTGAGPLPAYGSVKPKRSALVLTAPAGKHGWLRPEGSWRLLAHPWHLGEGEWHGSVLLCYRFFSPSYTGEKMHTKKKKKKTNSVNTLRRISDEDQVLATAPALWGNNPRVPSHILHGLKALSQLPGPRDAQEQTIPGWRPAPGCAQRATAIHLSLLEAAPLPPFPLSPQLTAPRGLPWPPFPVRHPQGRGDALRQQQARFCYWCPSSYIYMYIYFFF